MSSQRWLYKDVHAKTCSVRTRITARAMLEKHESMRAQAYLLQQRPAASDALVHGVVEAVVRQVPHQNAKERRQRQRLHAAHRREVMRFMPWTFGQQSARGGLTSMKHHHSANAWRDRVGRNGWTYLQRYYR